MIIWGHGRKLQSLGPVGRIESCPNCGNPTTLHLGVLKKDFKLYFIPVARWNSVYFIYCEICNASAEIDRDVGRQAHEALQAGTAGLDATRLLGQLNGGTAQEFRQGDIVAARRDIEARKRVVITQGQRLRIQGGGHHDGKFFVSDGDGKVHSVSRGHLNFVRRGVQPKGGETWVAATSIQSAKGDHLLATKGQHLEIVTMKKDGRVSVVDAEGNHFWVQGTLLDPFVDQRQAAILEPVAATNTTSEEPVALNSTTSVAPSEIYEHLRNLGKLQEEGILSEEEFQAKKAELLARL